MTNLRTLDAAATQGKGLYVDASGSNGPWVRIVADDETGENLVEVCDKDNAAFIAALVNAYRTGKLKEIV